MRPFQLLSLSLVFVTILLSSCQEEEAAYTLSPKKYVAVYLLDSDSDKVPDSKDNCPHAYNPDQKDSDGDGHGDVCDTDYEYDETPSAEAEPDFGLDCENERDCFTVPKYEFLTLRRAPRPKPCDSGICLEYIGLLMNKEGFFFNPEAEHLIQFVDPKSGKIVGVQEPIPVDKESDHLAFKVPEKLSSSFEALQINFRAQAWIDNELVDIEFSVIVTREATEFL